MKMFLTSLLLLLGAHITGLGAISPASEPNYDFDTNTCSYGALGFGSQDAVLKFMTNQITTIEIGVYQQNGTGGFEHGLHYSFDKSVETIRECMIRIANTEFQRSVKAHGYATNQRFSMKFYFNNSVSSPQFGAGHLNEKISFTPVKVGDDYTVPSDVIQKARFQIMQSAGDMLAIYWKGITKASLTVFRKNGSVYYNGSGDDQNTYLSQNFEVVNDQELLIAKRFLTNHYTGVLSVALKNGTSVTYLLSDGSFVYYPETIIQPYLTVDTTANGETIVRLSIGAPRKKVSLLCSSDLNLPPLEELITLDDVGTATWTNTTKLPMGIFTTRYPDFEELSKKQ